jgi:hypothetical protein
MAKQKRKAGKTASKTKPVPPVTTLPVWEDDPEPAVLVERPVPDLAKQPLAFSFSGKAPQPGRYQQGTDQFRYWTTAEALRRGADFWAGFVPAGKWQVGPILKVLRDEGADLNAYYDRNALNFFHGEGPGGTVYSAESPDIACHEMGHAVLDAIKPQLWDAMADEVAAFHEAFGDISAILSALQLSSLRTAILSDTKGQLYRNSRLSRLAEQLGSAIRMSHPDLVEADSLRNAVNSFTYVDPISLPANAPATQLSSEPHSFSRVFTGAVFESMAGMLSAKAKTPAAPTPDELAQVATEIARILVSAIKQAPVVPNFYAQVAGVMVVEAAKIDPKYAPALKGVFVRRAILSLHSATHVEQLHNSVVAARQARMAGAAPSVNDELEVAALPAGNYGLAHPLFVRVASHHRPYLAQGGNSLHGVYEPPSSSTAARSFTDDLFRRGAVHYRESSGISYRLDSQRTIKTHHVVKTKGGHQLERMMFDCGFCFGGNFARSRHGQVGVRKKKKTGHKGR